MGVGVIPILQKNMGHDGPSVGSKVHLIGGKGGFELMGYRNLVVFLDHVEV